ncbi:class I SAM-dependent methyltransferase, partial [Desulfovibrio sp. OttesenSCG-928-M16]|nr:class I SAM-dependent methyltransferase [Desulfovibrio sp. OttesenSCG-928-M16]
MKRNTTPIDWQSWSKIPWDEPGFSARMLENHLSQEHDWASRTNAAIDAQVAFIHEQLPSGARILDLGCGPGLYTSRLSALGHECTGVDFSPASINHARGLPDADTITYIHGDIKSFHAAGTFDAVLLLFGEINAFSCHDAAVILENAAQALRQGGKLFIETHTFDAIRDIGFLPSTWQTLETGLFSDKPHLYLEEYFWNEALAIAMTRYYVIDADTGGVAEYSAFMQAYSEAQ